MTDDDDSSDDLHPVDFDADAQRQWTTIGLDLARLGLLPSFMRMAESASTMIVVQRECEARGEKVPEEWRLRDVSRVDTIHSLLSSLAEVFAEMSDDELRAAAGTDQIVDVVRALKQRLDAVGECFYGHSF